MRPIRSSRPITRIERYKTKLYGCGISELIFGFTSIAMGIATHFVREDRPWWWYQRNDSVDFTNSSQGIWAGIILCLSGVLGIYGKSRPSVTIYKNNMAMSIFAAISAGVGFILSIIALTDTSGTLTGIHSGIMLCLLGGIVSSIVHSAYCCAGVCAQNEQLSPGQTTFQVTHATQYSRPRSIPETTGWTSGRINSIAFPASERDVPLPSYIEAIGPPPPYKSIVKL